MDRRSLRNLIAAAVIAALYVVLTLISYPIAFGPIQLRLSEALMLLVPVMPAAVPGVTLGCFLANLANPNNLGPVDYIGGSLATLLAALTTARLANRIRHRNPDFFRPASSVPFARRKAFYLLPLPSILFNGLIVGIYLSYLILPAGELTLPAVLYNMTTFSICEALTCYLFGLPLLAAAIEKQAFFAGVE